MKRAIIKAFKAHSLTLAVDANKFLQTELETRLSSQTGGSDDSNPSADNAQAFLDQLLAAADKSKLSKNLVTLEVLEGWLKAWDKANAAHQTAESFETGAPDNPDASVLRVVLEEDELFQVCNAFDPQSMKPWKFSPTRKYFEVDSSGPAAPLLADAHARVEHLRQRYWIIHQRLQRVLNGGVFNNSLKLTPIESLTGTLGTKRVLGMVVQKEEGKWYLEDPKASIEMDFSALGKEDSIKSGFFTEGCVCLVSGEVQNDRDAFLVQEICFGGAEPRDVTEKAFPSIDFFGANLEHRLVARLQAYEKHFANDGLDNILLLSDVWLDDAKVMEKLIQVIEGANSAPPFAFVLMGNFVTSANTASMSTYIQCFERLAEALATAPALLQKTRLIFVPGPADPTASRDVLPSPALSKPIRDAFEKRLRRASAGIQRTKSSAHGDFARFFFTSNPVRLRYCTKQIVLFREDISNKLRRHCFLNPATDDMTDHLVRTVCDQSHLCPLPITIKPVYWNYDHAMRLYPLPNMIALADQAARYSIEYEGTKVLSPGSFSIDSTFSSLLPLTGQITEYTA